MIRFGMTLMLRDDPEAIERYRREHAQAWPAVVARLRDIGIIGMRIYLLDRRLFMEMDTVDEFDIATGFTSLDEDETYRRWDELMTSLQERAPEAAPGEWWARMEVVFDLKWFDGDSEPSTQFSS